MAEPTAITIAWMPRPSSRRGMRRRWRRCWRASAHRRSRREHAMRSEAARCPPNGRHGHRGEERKSTCLQGFSAMPSRPALRTTAAWASRNDSSTQATSDDSRVQAAQKRRLSDHQRAHVQRGEQRAEAGHHQRPPPVARHRPRSRSVAHRSTQSIRSIEMSPSTRPRMTASAALAMMCVVPGCGRRDARPRRCQRAQKTDIDHHQLQLPDPRRRVLDDRSAAGRGGGAAPRCGAG